VAELTRLNRTDLLASRVAPTLPSYQTASPHQAVGIEELQPGMVGDDGETDLLRGRSVNHALTPLPI
jgi:hypothetical protein